MAADQFSLCWNNFHSNLSSGFHSLYQSEDFVDVTLAADGRYLKAHKMVLSVCSQYFKDLFMVNPCKHPIVILKDVSYCALRDLLQFMYLGEVSVSQEELGNLMKVAELLQIKGLTEETVDTSHINHNGLKNIHVSESKSISDSRAFLKRSRTVKKSKIDIPSKVSKFDPPGDDVHTIGSVTPTNATDSADGSVSISGSILEPELLVTPKQEPLDIGHGLDASDGAEYSEHSMTDVDVSMMLDTSLGGETSVTPSSHHSQIYWKSEPSKLTPPPDSNTPGGLRFLTTPKGRTVVIHNGHMYTLSQHKEAKTTWVCVMQRKLNCPGQVTTTSPSSPNAALPLPIPSAPPMLLSYTGHNHSQLNDIIQRLDTNSLQ